LLHKWLHGLQLTALFDSEPLSSFLNLLSTFYIVLS